MFVVSPEPDLHVYDIDILKDRCLILATDGAWNVVSPDMAVQSVYEAEKSNERRIIDPQCSGTPWINPAKRLVDLAIERWNMCSLRADNTSIVTVMLDPVGPPRAQVLRKRQSSMVTRSQDKLEAPPALPPKPSTRPQDSGKNSVSVLSRYPNSEKFHSRFHYPKHLLVSS